MKDDDLKACPFCGGDRFESISTSSTMGHGDSGNKTSMRCYGCGVIVTHDGSYFDMFDAERWNRRVHSPAMVKLLETVRLQGCTCTRSWPRAGNHEDVCCLKVLADLHKESGG
jgi:hypothetical protein